MGYLFIAIYLVIILAVIEISAVLLAMTGLDKKIARFQAISMLTSTGYTTGESELINEHPLRRRLGGFLILFGTFSLAVIISAITSILSNNFFTVEIGYIAAILVTLMLILKIPSLQEKMARLLKSEVKESFPISDLPIRDILETGEDDHMFELAVSNDSKYTGKTCATLIGDDEDIMVLFIQRGDIKIRNLCRETSLHPGDRVILYGNQNSIQKKFGEDLKSETEMEPFN